MFAQEYILFDTCDKNVTKKLQNHGILTAPLKIRIFSFHDKKG